MLLKKYSDKEIKGTHGDERNRLLSHNKLVDSMGAFAMCAICLVILFGIFSIIIFHT